MSGILAFVGTLLLVGIPAWTQTTFATITGTVTDPTGAVIPNVTVSATHVATNITTTTESNEAGVYTLPQLKEGEYTVSARAPGSRNSSRRTLSWSPATTGAWTSPSRSARSKP